MASLDILTHCTILVILSNFSYTLPVVNAASRYIDCSFSQLRTMASSLVDMNISGCGLVGMPLSPGTRTSHATGALSTYIAILLVI